MLTFWDTVRGHQLADTLIKDLPRLTERKRQAVITVESPARDAEVQDAINSGHAIYVGSYKNSFGQSVVILEELKGGRV